jgi:hypothetical protein
VAYSVDWPTGVITIPRLDLQLVQASPEIRQLDLDAFRLQMRELEASEAGEVWPYAVNHVAPLTVSGTQLARVVELVNGYTVTFEDGQWAVNIVGGNSNVLENTNRNQVSVAPNNSAGLTFSREQQTAAFEGGVIYIDPDRGLSGTQYPRGTPGDPVDNYDDAKVIADGRGFFRYRLEGALILDSDSVVADTDWFGNQEIQSHITFDGADVSACVFDSLAVTGQFSGRCSLITCTIDAGGITGFNGILTGCRLVGDIILDADADEDMQFHDCRDGDYPNTQPELDMNGVAVNVLLSQYWGGITIKNATGGGGITIDSSSATVLFDSSCTDGIAVVRGIVRVIDESGPGFTIEDEGVIDPRLVQDMATILGIRKTDGFVNTSSGTVGAGGTLTTETRVGGELWRTVVTTDAGTADEESTVTTED